LRSGPVTVYSQSRYYGEYWFSFLIYNLIYLSMETETIWCFVRAQEHVLPKCDNNWARNLIIIEEKIAETN